MRYLIPTAAMAAFAALAIGCDSMNMGPDVEQAPEPVAVARLDEVKAETVEAAQAMKGYAYAKRVEFVAAMKTELDATQEEMDRISARIDSSNDAVKADASAKLEAVRVNWTQTKQMLDQAESATEDSWGDVVAGFEKSHDKLKDSFEATRQWLSDKIEP